jgi:hypothetical protein
MNQHTKTDPTNEVGLDPHEAAALIEETTSRARRQLSLLSPVTAGMGAVVFLLGYGVAWWSMRDQRVSTVPAWWAVAALYALIVIAAVIASVLFRHRRAGVGGTVSRQMLATGCAVVVAAVAAWTVQGALRYLGVSFEIVYGVYGPTVPLIIVTAAATGFVASRRMWPELTLAMVIMLIAAGSTFFGPEGAWGLTGIGCAVALVVYAVVTAVGLRRRIAR